VARLGIGLECRLWLWVCLGRLGKGCSIGVEAVIVDGVPVGVAVAAVAVAEGFVIDGVVPVPEPVVVFGLVVAVDKVAAVVDIAGMEIEIAGQGTIALFGPQAETVVVLSVVVDTAAVVAAVTLGEDESKFVVMVVLPAGSRMVAHWLGSLIEIVEEVAVE
jgi:hypothetical protein